MFQDVLLLQMQDTFNMIITMTVIVGTVDIPSITKSTGDARRVNGTRPKDIPFCGLGVEGRYIAVPWKLCRDETATVYSITHIPFGVGR